MSLHLFWREISPITHLCQGLNSHYFHIMGDGHQPNSRGLYTHYKDSLLKGGMTIPNIATFDHGTVEVGSLFQDFFHQQYSSVGFTNLLHASLFVASMLAVSEEIKKVFCASNHLEKGLQLCAVLGISYTLW